jgi:hypothetical protein
MGEGGQSTTFLAGQLNRDPPRLRTHTHTHTRHQANLALHQPSHREGESQYHNEGVLMAVSIVVGTIAPLQSLENRSGQIAFLYCLQRVS